MDRAWTMYKMDVFTDDGLGRYTHYILAWILTKPDINQLIKRWFFLLSYRWIHVTTSYFASISSSSSRVPTHSLAVSHSCPFTPRLVARADTSRDSAAANSERWALPFRRSRPRMKERGEYPILHSAKLAEGCPQHSQNPYLKRQNTTAEKSSFSLCEWRKKKTVDYLIFF